MTRIAHAFALREVCLRRAKGRFCAVAIVAWGLSPVFSMPAHAQNATSASGQMTGGEIHVTVKGLPEIVLPSMNAARGRVYFATRACVVCHSVNGVGGNTGPALDYEANGKAIEPLEFVTLMWRGARPMLALQESLFGEPIDLTAEELGDIIAFLHDPNERKKFSEKDIPQFIRDFMTGRAGAGKR